MNQLTVNQSQSIEALAAQGHSKRKIARLLKVDRETVGKHLAKTVEKTTDQEAQPPHKPGPVSSCEPWRERLQEGRQQGLSVQRLFQDLVLEENFTGSYHAVRRFVSSLEDSFQPEEPFRRMECAPGEELQVDFGLGAYVIVDGKRRRPHLFRAVLSHSRKGYCEVRWRQTTDDFIRCLENTFRALGGVPQRVVIDNLKAGVIKADWYDPDLNPKLVEFARHYGTVILPTKPATPRHKGKVEAGVKYVQNNALKGRTFPSLEEENRFLITWERTIADVRIHGTIRQPVEEYFHRAEKATLKPLPIEAFPDFIEAPRKVHRDGYVEFERAYYSVPPEYVGRKVWVRRQGALIRVYDEGRRQIALHAQTQVGAFNTDSKHIGSRKRHLIERGPVELLAQCRLVGVAIGNWAQGAYEANGPQGLRQIVGLIHMAKTHPIADLERAASIASQRGAWRLRDLKKLMKNPSNIIEVSFLEEHPLIRPLESYHIALPEVPETEDKIFS